MYNSTLLCAFYLELDPTLATLPQLASPTFGSVSPKCTLNSRQLMWFEISARGNPASTTIALHPFLIDRYTLAGCILGYIPSRATAFLEVHSCNNGQNQWKIYVWTSTVHSIVEPAHLK